MAKLKHEVTLQTINVKNYAKESQYVKSMVSLS